MIYLIHFDKPFKHARHYLGFVESESELHKRIERHRKGNGAKLLRAVANAGIDWKVVRTWPDGDRTTERKMKNTRNVPDYCPICRAEKRVHASTQSEQ